ncbi:hypothetical protein [Ruegeria sp. HKCCD7255]|uniref:hypothetical protein n=1 Tax=Ruegeria sp. HKCCD7255 TaxID=2683004 RepID=UPI001488AEF5|nr:hypothetical protein [Ruegeria sp. HKCCD7255]
MTAWTLFYENRFPPKADGPDITPDDFRGVEGQQTVKDFEGFIAVLDRDEVGEEDEARPPRDDAGEGRAGFGIGPGRNIVFEPTRKMQDVVGADITLRLAVSFMRVGQSCSVLSLGQNGIALGLTALEAADENNNQKFRLEIQTSVGTVTVAPLILTKVARNDLKSFLTLRVRWEAKGQLRVWRDDDLIAYENAVGVGLKLRLDRIMLGEIGNPLEGTSNVMIAGLRVLELREDAAAGELGDILDPRGADEIADRCNELARLSLNRLTTQMRGLMAGFIQNQTTPWRQGMAQPAFSESALALHASAQNAGLALPRYLQSGDEAERTSLIEGLSEVLTSLAADQPQLFDELLATSVQPPADLLETCGPSIDRLRQENGDLMARLEPISTELEAVVQRIREAQE